MQPDNRHSNPFCNCTGAPPWPGMVKLSANATHRYYVCRECGAVCEEVCRPDGAVAEVRWHAADRRDALPASIVGQMQNVLEQIEPEMILVPAGEFLIGCSNADIDAILADCHDCKREWYTAEQPQHVLDLPAYYIAKTPITNAQYKIYTKSSGHSLPQHWQDGRPPFDRDDHPVVGVSWHDGMAYCRWLANVTGKPYHLPTEAQWEKAARGMDGRAYPWGNTFDASRCNCSERGEYNTTPVETFAQGASPYGALDMVGNVWEWTQSIYKEYPYNAGDGREDFGANGRRVLRGGAFCYNRYDIRCTFRSSYRPKDAHTLIGFRVVFALDIKPSA